jgi:hypothetical protein
MGRRAAVVPCPARRAIATETFERDDVPEGAIDPTGRGGTMSRPTIRTLTRLLSWLPLAGWGLGALSAADEPRRVALLVGVNRSEIRILADSPLQFAERDVQELAAVLRSKASPSAP